MANRLGATLVVCAIPFLVACESTPTPTAPPSAPAPSSGPVASDSPAPSAAAEAAFTWDAPKDGATVRKKQLTLRATADGVVADDATVTFTVDWPGSPPQPACEAHPGAGGTAECRVDLAALKAPSGSLRLGFDVDSGSGAVVESPDGKRTLEYRPPAPTWRSARTILPKACDLPALTIASGRYHVATTCGSSIRYAEGAATGGWSETTLGTPARHDDRDPQLAVDGDTLHLAFTRYGPATDAETCGTGVLYEDLGVYERTRSLPDGRWSKPRRLGREDDVLDAFRVVDGTVHATVGNNTSGRTFYETVDGGQTVRVPLKRVGSGTSLRVGDDGKGRIAYVDWRNGDLQLVTVDGTSVSRSVVADDGYLLDPLLVLGPGNQPHLVWTRDETAQPGCAVPGPKPADGTWYATLVDGAWVPERITKATGPTSLVVDTDTGAVHVLVNGNRNAEGGGSLRHFERAPGGGWTSTKLRGAAEGGAVIRRDDADGTLAVLFKDGEGDPVQMVTRR